MVSQYLKDKILCAMKSQREKCFTAGELAEIVGTKTVKSVFLALDVLMQEGRVEGLRYTAAWRLRRGGRRVDGETIQVEVKHHGD